MALWLLLAVFCGPMAGCDNTIDPLTEAGRDMFAVHGFLDAAADTQFVRIEALRENVLEPPTQLTDITVQSSDVETGLVITWQDSLVTLDDGGTGVVFFALFTPQAGQTYELRMFRSGRDGASARTTLPEAAGLELGPQLGELLQLRQRVILMDTDSRPENVRVHYTVHDPGTNTVNRVQVGYGIASAISGNDWQVDVFLKVDQLTVLRELNKSIDDTTVGLRKVSISYQLQSPEWDDPTKRFVMQNAAGFFSSIGYFEQEWTIDSTTVSEIGFVNQQ